MKNLRKTLKMSKTEIIVKIIRYMKDIFIAEISKIS